MTDVAIVGGGPGGLHGAALLARAGFAVSVYEEHAATGSPVHCTGVFAADAFDEFGLDRSSVLNPLTTARFFSPSTQSVSYTTSQIEAVAIDRLAFDQMLFERAHAAGAEMVLGRRVDDVAVDPGGVTLRFKDGGEARARAAVLACGANYVVQRRVGLGMPATYLQSAQLELPAGRPGDVEVHFGREVAPNGFAWVVPVRRETGWHARVGLMCERDSLAYFRQFLSRVAGAWQIDSGAAAAEPRQKLLPLAPIARTYADRLLAVGDAAGIVKATTGGGIYYSLVSATIAAEVLARALPHDRLSSRDLATYESQWRDRLGPEMDAQLELRHLAHRMDDGDIEALFELARTDGVMPIVRATARFNHHRAVILAVLKHPPVRRILFDRLRGAGKLQHALD